MTKEKLDIEEPYIIKTITKQEAFYNPEFGDNRICKCGHKYYRHFDTYESMFPAGCKYCDCFRFIEK